MNERAAVFHEMTDAYASALERLEAEGLTLNSETLTEPDIAALLEHYSAITHVSRKTHEQLLAMENAKRQIHAELNAELEAIREGRPNPNEPRNAFRVVASAAGGYTVKFAGEKLTLTEGDLLTNGEWGIEYSLDPAHVSPRVREAYAIERAKRKVRELVNKQILTMELVATGVPWRRGRGKPNVWAKLSSKKTARERGHLAERMVRTYLKKAAIDLALPFTVLEANLYQDCIDKIDFIVHIADTGHMRGVEVDESEGNARNIVVQFTTGSEKLAKEKEHGLKQESIRQRIKEQGLDDAVVVRMPMQYVEQDFESWNTRHHPLGPTAYWTNKERYEVLTKVLANELNEEELRHAGELLPRNTP